MCSDWWLGDRYEVARAVIFERMYIVLMFHVILLYVGTRHETCKIMRRFILYSQQPSLPHREEDETKCSIVSRYLYGTCCEISETMC